MPILLPFDLINNNTLILNDINKPIIRRLNGIETVKSLFPYIKSLRKTW